MDCHCKQKQAKQTKCWQSWARKLVFTNSFEFLSLFLFLGRHTHQGYCFLHLQYSPRNVMDVSQFEPSGCFFSSLNNPCSALNTNLNSGIDKTAYDLFHEFKTPFHFRPRTSLLELLLSHYALAQRTLTKRKLVKNLVRLLSY